MTAQVKRSLFSMLVLLGLSGIVLAFGGGGGGGSTASCVLRDTSGPPVSFLGNTYAYN
jgi:hypothetical protein